MATRRLINVMRLLGISLAALLGACGKNPTNADVVGSWVNADGAQLTLEQNGQFTAHALPQAIFFRRDLVRPPVDGKGTWRLEKGQPYWEVKLSFKEINGHPDSYGTSALVSGGGDSTYLYQWVGEEGENRYKLERKPGAP